MKKIHLLLTFFIAINLQGQEEQFTSFNIGQEFTTITVDGFNKKVWAGTNQNGVFNLDIDVETLPSDFSIFNGSDSGGPDLSDIQIKSMAADALGNIWIGHEGINYSGGLGGMERISSNLNVKHYSPDRNALGFSFFQRDGLGTLRARSVTIDKNNTVWVAQRYHDLVSGSDYILTPGSLSYKTVDAPIFTTKGTWWPDPNNQPTELPYPAYTLNPTLTQTAQSRNMQAISSDNSGVWVGVYGYIVKDDDDDTSNDVYIPARVLRYNLDGTHIPSGAAHNGFSFADMNIPTGGVINGICANNNKGTWVTTTITGKGFSVYKNGTWHYIDNNTGGFSQIIPPDTKFNDNAIWKDKIGRVFMGTTKGLIVYNGHGDVTLATSYRIYTNYDYGNTAGNELNVYNPDMLSNNITGGSSDPKDPHRSWIATDTGIMKLFLPPNGVTLYHVKDHFSYVSTTIDTEENITFLTQLKNELNNDNDLAVDSEIPSVAADKSRSTVFRFNTDDPAGFYATNPSYRLMVGPDYSSSVSEIDTPEYIKRYGQFVIKNLSSYEGSPTSADQLDFVEFIYIHPEYIDASDYETDKNYAKFYFRIMDVTDIDNPDKLFEHPIKVAVPPVLIGHGVWSGVGSVEDIKNYLLDNGFDDYMLSLAWRPQVDNDDDKAPENSFYEDAWVIPTYIKRLKDNAVANMFSAGKVNVVMHSRGGLYTRGYIEGIDPQNYYREDINSLITLNTPHFGAQGANLVLDKRILVTKETIENAWNALISNFIPLGLLVDLQDITLGSVASLTVPLQDRVENWGAKNLVVENDNVSGIGPSDNIDFIPTLNHPSNLAKLSEYELPIHTISSEFDICINHPNLCGNFSQLLGTLNKTSKILFLLVKMGSNDYFLNGLGSVVEKIYNGETNDFVVPLTSMQGGLGGTPYNTNFNSSNNIDHSGKLGTGVAKATIVHDRILHLLKSNIHDSQNSLFTKNGLNHSSLTYNFLHDVLTSASQRNTEEFQSKILINRDPAIFDNRVEGDVLTFNVLQEEVDEIMITFESKSDSSNFTYEIRSQNLSFENQFTYTIPQGFSGEMTITAYGFDNDIFGLAKSKVTLNVGIPEAITLQGIHFEQENPIILNQENYSYNLIGTFSDGIERNINDLDGLTFTIEDTTIISQIDNSSIKAEAVGSTLLIATIGDFEDSILVEVQNNPSLQQTILTSFYGVPDIDNNTIHVFWETLREYENETFVLETSYNTPDNFTEINQQSGNGTFSDPAQFNFADTTFGSNTLIFYRLKMINTLGDIFYSPTIEIDLSTLSVNTTTANIDLKLYPNPVKTNNVTLSLNSNLIDQNAKLELYSLQGKRLSLQTLNVVQGSNTFNLKLSKALHSGIYLVRVTTAGYIKTIKLVVNK